jgi:hypothetical protein
MANEFKIKKGLIVSGSGGTLLDVQGSVGQVLSITDSLTGDIFSVSDVSGIPIFNVNSNGTSYFDGKLGVGVELPVQKVHVVGSQVRLDTAAGGYYLYNTSNVFRGAFHDNGTTTNIFGDGNGSTPALSIESNNVTFAGNVTLNTGTAKKLSILASTHDTNTAQTATLELGYTHSGGDAAGNIVLTEAANNAFDADMTFGLPHNNGSGGSSTRTALTLDGGTLAATFAGNLTVGSNNITGAQFYVQGTYPRIYLSDTNSNDDYSIINDNGTFIVYNDTDSSTAFSIAGNNNATFASDVTINGRTTITRDSDALRLNSSSTNGTYLGFQNNGTFKGYIGSAYHLFSSPANSADHLGFRAETQHTFGIQATPVQKITSSGIDVTGNIIASGTVTANGTVLTGNQDLSPYTTTNGSGDEWKFTLGDEGNLSGNKWYKVARVNQGNGGLHIKGYLSNHVETFGTQKVDLAIQDRETNTEIEISGTVDVLHNAASGTDKVGIRVIKSDTASHPNWDYWDVYIRTTRYTQAKFHLVKMGTTSFYTTKPSVTSEPAPVSGGTVELDTSTLLEGQHVIVDSAVKLYVAVDGARVTGSITATGDVIAYASSDKRLKDNIELISNPIKKVQSLKGVTWNWNDKADKLQQSLPTVGVVAQDVEKVLPQLVTNKNDGFKGVDYAKLTGLLIEAIKDQQKQIDGLKSQMAACNKTACNCKCKN